MSSLLPQNATDKDTENVNLPTNHDIGHTKSTK